MNSINLLMQNGTTTMFTGLNAGILSYFFMPDGSYELPFIGYDIPQWSAYALLGALSASFVGLTGDFIFPLISRNQYLNKAQMISRPLSVGLLSLVVMYAMNSFEMMDYETMMKVFLLSSGSYLVADWTVSKWVAPNPGIVKIEQPRTMGPVPSIIQRTPVDRNDFGSIGSLFGLNGIDF